MHSTHRKQRRRDGFTLIELLVVISIISLLIAILLPALGMAREAALNIVCQNRHRQIDMATYNYAADFKNWIAPGRMMIALPFTQQYTVTYVYRLGRLDGWKTPNDYGLDTYQDWLCPVENRTFSSGYRHIASNTRITGDQSSSSSTYNTFHRYDDLKAGHNEVILYGDNGTTTNFQLIDEWRPAYRHFVQDLGRNGTANIAYADGHVESRSYAAMTTAPSYNNANFLAGR